MLQSFTPASTCVVALNLATGCPTCSCRALFRLSVSSAGTAERLTVTCLVSTPHRLPGRSHLWDASGREGQRSFCVVVGSYDALVCSEESERSPRTLLHASYHSRYRSTPKSMATLPSASRQGIEPSLYNMRLELTVQSHAEMCQL